MRFRRRKIIGGIFAKTRAGAEIVDPSTTLSPQRAGRRDFTTRGV